MQTFLPYPNFFTSAQMLDKKRCWKQVVEAKQIISVLEGNTTAWANHPAVKMWVGHTDLLKHYFNQFLYIAKTKHSINTKMEPYGASYQAFHRWRLKDPWWMGNEDFHRAMRARLIEKDLEFYGPIFPKDRGFNNGLYLWPDMETKTFKIILPK